MPLPSFPACELPWFDDHHRAFAADFADWVTRELAPFAADEGQDGVAARAVYQRLAADGWLARCVGPAGAPVDLRTAALARALLAHHSAIADVAFSEPWLAVLPLLDSGSPAQRETVDAFVAGRCLPAFALSEPGAGSDAGALTTTASPLPGGGYRIDGCKTWTSNAGLADAYVVFARLAGEPGAAGISAFLVPGRQPGLRLRERLQVMSPHTVGTLDFEGCEGCEVGAETLVGQPSDGLRLALTALERFRPTVGAAALGFARRAFDEALARSTVRSAFGKPIAEHQLIQAKLADMAVRIAAAEGVVWRAAWAHDTARPGPALDAAIAKLHATETAQVVVDQALQVFGGLGVVHGSVVERLYRHVRAFRIFDGTSEIQHLVIARHLLQGRPSPTAL